MYVLEKLSIPGWDFRTEHIEQAYLQLDASICKSCKLTKSEYQKATEQVDAEYEDDWTWFKPDNFEDLGYLEKIEWLLCTPCGCEFHFDEE